MKIFYKIKYLKKSILPFFNYIRTDRQTVNLYYPEIGEKIKLVDVVFTMHLIKLIPCSTLQNQLRSY